MMLTIAIMASLLVHDTVKTTQVQRDKGDYVSPDGKYVAHVAADTAPLCLWIYRVAPNYKHVLHSTDVTHSKGVTHSKLALNEVIDVDGVVWVPGRAHTLVFATSSTYGTAELGLWHKGSHFRRLVKIRHPDKENFQLTAISRDGRALTYLHGLVAEQGEDTYLRRRLSLPKP